MIKSTIKHTYIEMLEYTPLIFVKKYFSNMDIMMYSTIFYRYILLAYSQKTVNVYSTIFLVIIC